MPFIGQQPLTGAYSKLDSITTSATATYNLQLDSAAYSPASANHLLVSLNGVMQAPQDSFTVSGSTITFASALTSSDNIDFIMALGDVLNIGTPSDGTVTAAKIASNAVSTAKIASNAVSTAKIASNAVSTAKIAASAVTDAKIASSIDLSGKTVDLSGTNKTFPVGHVIQTVRNVPGTVIFIQIGSSSTPSFTEFSTSYRLSITPKFANSILKLTWNGLVGGRNNSAIISMKFYDQTNSSNVGVGTLGTGSNRTPVNASMRTVDADTNDRHSLTMTAYQAAGNTNARTYGVYGAMESNATFSVNMTSTDNAGCSFVQPNFTIQEIAQ
jgi:hypothetical protein